MKILFLSLCFSAFVLHAQISLSPGTKMPDVTANWLHTPANKPMVSGQKQIFVLNLVDVITPDIYQTLRLIESIEKKYARETGAAITIQTVAKNDASLLKRILESDKNPYTLAIGSDKDSKTFRNFNAGVASLPYTFIAQNGAIAWSGHPVEIETVVDSMLDGSFSRSKQEIIARYRKDLQTALRAGLSDVAAQTADRILAIAPNDTIAIQARLYTFELKGQTAKSAEFLQKHIKQHPRNAQRNRLLLLDLLSRSGDMTTWQTAAKEAAAEAKKNPEDALNLTAYLLDRAPLQELPIREILILSDIPVAHFKKSQRQDIYADALEIAAKARYSACKINDAIRLQNEALTIRKNTKSPFRERTEKTLAFYTSLKNI